MTKTIVITDKEAIQKVYNTFVRDMTPKSLTTKLKCVYNKSINGVGCAFQVIFPVDIPEEYEGESARKVLELQREFTDINVQINIQLSEKLQAWHDTRLYNDMDQNRRHDSFMICFSTMSEEKIETIEEELK